MSVNPSVGEEKISELVAEFWPVQPEPGSVADQLIKKGEARGKAEGKAEERRRTVRVLQSILGLTESSEEDLAGRSLEALGVMIEDLQQQVAKRVK